MTEELMWAHSARVCTFEMKVKMRTQQTMASSTLHASCFGCNATHLTTYTSGQPVPRRDGGGSIIDHVSYDQWFGRLSLARILTGGAALDGACTYQDCACGCQTALVTRIVVRETGSDGDPVSYIFWERDIVPSAQAPAEGDSSDQLG